MSLSDTEKNLISTYPYWDLNPDHPNDCVTRQSAIHLVDECRSTGYFPDNANGHWTMVMEAIRETGWHIADIRGKFELVKLKEGVVPGLKRLTDSDVLFYLY